MVSTSRVQVFAILAGAFVLGGLSSAGAYHVFAERRYAELLSGERDSFQNLRVQALARELSLSDEQRELVRGVYRQHSAEHRRLMRQTFDACGQPLAQHKERIDLEIRKLLGPEQRARFEALRAEQRRRRLGSPSSSPAARAP